MNMAALEGRVALITGASRGIGAALALELAKLGAQCVLVARTQGGLEEVDDAIRAAGGKPATLLPFDLQKAEKDIDMIGPSIVERFGRLALDPQL
jgi:NAD(P)-dependent dehydrogenase (short-subunit alcohol dehydrogenase family)